MDLPVEAWYPAIFRRHSRRAFSPRPIGPEQRERLALACRDFRPFPGARSEFVEAAAEPVFRGLVGGYGRVSGAPHYLAFIGDDTVPHVQEAAGYMGEGLILEATALGLGSCWVGGFFRPEAVARDLSLAAGERVLAITPIGYPLPQKNLSEKLLEGLARSGRRKPLDELVLEGRPEGWSVPALEAARLSPSARNRQPWRFGVRAGAITLAGDDQPSLPGISKRLDCGIAMLHLELGARAHGVGGRWEFLDPPEVARFHRDSGP